MVRTFETREGALKETSEVRAGCWIHLQEPAPGELEEVREITGAPIDFFTDPLDLDERSRIEVEEGCLLMIIRVPRFQQDGEDVQFTTVPIGIIHTDRLIVTVCAVRNNVTDDFSGGKMRNLSTQLRSRFILQMFLRTATHYLNYLKEINKRTSAVENELHQSMRNEELIRLLNLEKSLVFFTTSLKSNEIIIERLERGDLVPLSPEEADFIDDAIIENKQAIEMANIYSNILSGMMDAFASVISNNLTVVMKFLTSMTIILMIPTLVASIYGMNIPLPFQRSPYAFLITMGMSFAMSGIGIFFFIKRKWF